MAKKPWGIAVTGWPTTFTNITNFDSAVGGTSTYSLFYHQFVGSGGVAYTSADFSVPIGAGKIPLFTWEPQDNTGVTHLSNAQIMSGTYDALIDSYANGIKAQSGTVFVRLAHEMNGNWYDWAPGNNGNTYTSYVNMWQYVWNRFATIGVPNAKWVWCPNIHNNDVATYTQLYPGNAYVDYIALDGYNYGDNAFYGWQTYSAVFAQSITDCIAVAPTKPFFISEIGCIESISTHSKASWILDALAQIQADSRIFASVWYSKIAGTQDFRVDSSTPSQLAFASGIVSTISYTKP